MGHRILRYDHELSPRNKNVIRLNGVIRVI